ncbi:hypothetical protein P7C73_g926, partial [Tremellales sp. Uapishka_1]
MSQTAEQAHEAAKNLMAAALGFRATFKDRLAFHTQLISLRAFNNPKCKNLMGTMLPKNFAEFPDLQDDAVDAILDLCEDDDEKIRMVGIKALASTAKAEPRWVRGNTGVLLQLLESPPKEAKIVREALHTLISISPASAFAVIVEDCRNQAGDKRAAEMVVEFLVDEAREERKKYLESGDDPEAEEAFVEGCYGILPTGEKSYDELRMLNLLLRLSNISGKRSTEATRSRCLRVCTATLAAEAQKENGENTENGKRRKEIEIIRSMAEVLSNLNQRQAKVDLPRQSATRSPPRQPRATMPSAHSKPPIASSARAISSSDRPPSPILPPPPLKTEPTPRSESSFSAPTKSGSFDSTGSPFPPPSNRNGSLQTAESTNGAGPSRRGPSVQSQLDNPPSSLTQRNGSDARIAAPSGSSILPQKPMTIRSQPPPSSKLPEPLSLAERMGILPVIPISKEADRDRKRRREDPPHPLDSRPSLLSRLGLADDVRNSKRTKEEEPALARQPSLADRIKGRSDSSGNLRDRMSPRPMQPPLEQQQQSPQLHQSPSPPPHMSISRSASKLSIQGRSVSGRSVSNTPATSAQPMNILHRSSSNSVQAPAIPPTNSSPEPETVVVKKGRGFRKSPDIFPIAPAPVAPIQQMMPAERGGFMGLRVLPRGGGFGATRGAGRGWNRGRF